MMLRRDEHFPFVYRRVHEVGPGVADEVPQDVLLQIGLAVRSSGPAQLVQAGEKRPADIAIAAIHTAVPPATGSGVRLGRSDLIDEVSQAVHDNFGNRHGELECTASSGVTYVLAAVAGRT
jgi:hypothetical protein